MCVPESFSNVFVSKNKIIRVSKAEAKWRRARNDADAARKIADAAEEQAETTSATAQAACHDPAVCTLNLQRYRMSLAARAVACRQRFDRAAAAEKAAGRVYRRAAREAEQPSSCRGGKPSKKQRAAAPQARVRYRYIRRVPVSAESAERA